MVDCRACKRRFRADKLDDDVWVHYCEATKGNKFNIPGGDSAQTLAPQAAVRTLLRRYHLVEKTGLSERECLFF